MTHRSLTLGAVALACACSTALATPNALSSAVTSSDTLVGLPKLACEAILCLSSSLQPSECTPSLDHYFGIKVFNRHGLDWGATVAARRAFLGTCPVGDTPGMPERMDAIANGAGKCDPDSLNSAFAATSYRYRKSTFDFRHMDDSRYEVEKISTVSQNTLPRYCVAYNDHAWTYDLSVKYVGEPLKGGYWVKASQYEAAQARWLADHGGQWSKGWTYSWHDPRNSSEDHHVN